MRDLVSPELMQLWQGRRSLGTLPSLDGTSDTPLTTGIKAQSIGLTWDEEQRVADILNGARPY